MRITPTLNFGGQCREAIHLYEKAFGGKISCLITYREANDPAYMPLLREDQKDYIYHSELVFGDQKIIMSDHVDIEFTVCYSNFLTIMYDTNERLSNLNVQFTCGAPMTFDFGIHNFYVADPEGNLLEIGSMNK